jgi:predicted nucleic acid-binding protein
MKLLISDTSVLLNLIAGDCVQEVAEAIGCQWVICTAVRDEVKFLRDVDTGNLTPIDLAPWLADGRLQVVTELSEAEQAQYLEEAALVDDGEAMSISVAKCRRLALAMDDRRAGRHFRELCPELKLWTTPDLFAAWADQCPESSERITNAIRAIRSRARYVPPRGHAKFGWWSEQLGVDK